MVAQQLAIPLLVHKRAVDDDELAECWPTLPLKLPAASAYKFHQCQGSHESKWSLVVS
jgi:hypothetical protein